MSRKEQIKKSLVEEKKAQALLKGKIAPLEKMLTASYNRRDALIEELSGIEILENKTLDEKVAYFIQYDGTVGETKYHAANEFFRELGLKMSGARHKTKQVALEIVLTYGDDDNLKKTVKALETVLPHIKPEDGAKRVRIFDHELSSHGIYELEFKNNSIQLVKIRSIRTETLKKFNTILDAVKYVQEHHWYDGKEVSIDEDECHC